MLGARWKEHTSITQRETYTRDREYTVVIITEKIWLY